MKLQDYLHYYMGCRVEAYPFGGQQKRTECGRLVGIGIHDIVNIKFDTWQSVADVSMSRVKPILRRLEGMTEEERKTIWWVIFGRVFPDSGNVLWFEKETTSSCKRWCMMSGVERVGIEMNGNVWADSDLSNWKFNPHVITHYLLQQSFDLFGLIDAGLAIDIKTI